MMWPTQSFGSAPAWLYELALARTDYEELLGWPVVLHVTSRRLTIPAGQLFDAVYMPAELGTPVQRQLRTMMLDSPVIAGPRPGWLTFLTRLPASAEPVLPADLERAGIGLARRGDAVVLPTTCDAADVGDVRWVNPPGRRRKPPAWSVVVAASRRVVARQEFDWSAPLLPRQRAA